jgi:hypothetical protein
VVLTKLCGPKAEEVTGKLLNEEFSRCTTSYRLNGSGFEFRYGQDIFFLSRTVNIGSVAHPTQWIPENFPGANRPERDIKRLLLDSVDIP